MREGETEGGGGVTKRQAAMTMSYAQHCANVASGSR